MSMSLKDKPKSYGQFDVKCKNKCGFYGNPEWEGYCSQCHKELHVLQKDVRPSKKVQRSHSDVQDSSLNWKFSKFEEKKKQHAEKRSKTIKSIIKRGHTLKETSSQSPSKAFFEPSDIFKICKENQLKESLAKDVIKQMQAQSDIISKHENKQSTDEQSEIMQDFYNFMFNRCETHPQYQDLSPEQVDLLMDVIEKQFMTHLYRSTFQQISTEYEDKDLSLQHRIRSLNWITAEHLFLNINITNPDVIELMDKAMTDALQVDSGQVPQGKISCIVDCSKSIFQILNLCSGGGVASADEFLPAMVYIILRANPARLQSNIKYITSYSIPARLRSGEGAYYFTNLCCAVAFIEDLNSESLNMNEDEFQRYMSGDILPQPDRQDFSDCEGVRTMTQNQHTLAQIQEHNNKVLNDLFILKENIIKFQESLQKSKSEPSLFLSPMPYTVPPNTDMSHIPDVLRSRIVFAPEEDILVEIDFNTDEEHLSSSDIISRPHMLPIECPSTELSNAPYSANAYLASLQSLKIELPHPTSETSSNFTVQSNINEAMVSIQNLEYPTELLPDEKPEEGTVEFGPFEGYNASDLEIKSDKVLDPLSPEPQFVGESLNLPPPLLPVVVQTSEQGKEAGLL